MNLFLILITIVILLFAILVLREFWLYTKLEYKLHKKFPTCKTHLFVGTLWETIFLNPEKTFKIAQTWANRFQTTYSHWIQGYLFINIIKGEDAAQILNSPKCINKSMLYKYVEPFMGTGLLTSAGQKWHNRRRLLTPAFHFNILQQFHRTFKNETNQLIESVKNDDNKLINLLDCMSRFTLNTVCETAMGVKITSPEESNKYLGQIHKIGEMLVYRLIRPWLFFNFVCKLIGYMNKLNKIMTPVHSFTREVIKMRRQTFFPKPIQLAHRDNIYETKKPCYAMLDTLLEAEARGEDIDNEGIREEVDTFMFEGHDTTATALTFILFLLAENPDIQQQLYEEVRDFATLQNIDEATMNDLNQLKYLDRVLKECLRIYPPVAFISRAVSEEIQFNDIMLPAGTIIFIHINYLHLDESQFPDPEKFDPDRFLPEETEKRQPFAYIPFSVGRRNCIGQKFALLEMKTLLVKLILNFQLEQVTKRDELVFVSDLVLRTKDPIFVKFNLRQ